MPMLKASARFPLRRPSPCLDPRRPRWENSQPLLVVLLILFSSRIFALLSKAIKHEASFPFFSSPQISLGGFCFVLFSWGLFCCCCFIFPDFFIVVLLCFLFYIFAPTQQKNRELKESSSRFNPKQLCREVKHGRVSRV